MVTGLSVSLPYVPWHDRSTDIMPAVRGAHFACSALTALLRAPHEAPSISATLRAIGGRRVATAVTYKYVLARSLDNDCLDKTDS